MVSMNLSTAVKSYQFGERAKSELIIASQLAMALVSFPEQERAGGKRMLLMLMETIRSEIQFAYNSTSQQDFMRATNALNEAISLVESNQLNQASEKIAAAISASTTSAQQAWQVLADHGLL
jgi:flagellin-specific chaperone FliS